MAAEVVRHLLRLGLVELGIEAWSTEPPGHIVDGKYVGIPFEGDVEATLADPASWGTDDPRRVVVSATGAGYDRYIGTGS